MSSKKPNNAENWLLDSVIKYHHPLDILLAEDIEEQFNRKGHGLWEPELTALLYRMFSDGLLIASTSIPPLGGPDWTEVDFYPTFEQVRAGLHREIDIYYGLTAEGGKTWESLTNTQWNKCVGESFCFKTRTRQIISMDVSRVRRELLHWDIMDRISHRVKNAVWDVVIPWEATYWKTLPYGHRASFAKPSFTEEECESRPIRETYRQWKQRERELRRWWKERDRWYTHPWR
ncbi:hypothetical protein IAD21_00629 [Abditibacteriota bacterium]|nr:hypothetical protein IAD21_00629 [Abditibacteriota bacterium]